MKLAAIYNVWDGLEHLEKSINLILPHVDEIIIVWQSVSNFGEHNPETEPLVNSLPYTLIEHVPDTKKGGTRNETAKREKGWLKAKELGCTHFIFMDCDEYYLTGEFGAAKQEFIARGLDTSYCKLVTYWKEHTLRYEPLENYYVPFICSTNVQSVGTGFLVTADPTRGVRPWGKCGEVNIKMHHMSFVRKDIGMKLRNSSANVNWSWQRRVQQFNDWQLGQKHPFMNYSIVETENLFG